MDEIERHRGWIEDHEQAFAEALASRAIPPPTRTIWRRIFPEQLISWFDRKRRGHSENRMPFKHRYLATRKGALAAAHKALDTGEDPELDRLTAEAQMPESGRAAYAGFIQVLVDHYQVLLEADGSSYAELVRAAYGGRTNYLLFCSELNQAERDLHAALKPPAEPAEDYGEAMARVEEIAEEMRRREAEDIFP